MSPRSRIMAALNHRQTDRIPLVTQRGGNAIRVLWNVKAEKRLSGLALRSLMLCFGPLASRIPDLHLELRWCRHILELLLNLEQRSQRKRSVKLAPHDVADGSVRLDRRDRHDRARTVARRKDVGNPLHDISHLATGTVDKVPHLLLGVVSTSASASNVCLCDRLALRHRQEVARQLALPIRVLDTECIAHVARERNDANLLTKLPPSSSSHVLVLRVPLPRDTDLDIGERLLAVAR